MASIQRKISLKNLRAFVGTEQYLHIILKSGEALRCRLVTIEKDKLVVKNALGHKLGLTLQQIRELWFDETVSRVP